MSAVGYPDYFRPRDYLGALQGTSQVDNAGGGPLGAGTENVTILTLPAGSTWVVTFAMADVSATADPAAAGPTRASIVVFLDTNIVGGAGQTILARAEIMLPAGGHDSEICVIPSPLVIGRLTGGASNLKVTGFGDVGIAAAGRIWSTLVRAARIN